MKKTFLSFFLILLTSSSALSQADDRKNKKINESNNELILNKNNVNFGLGSGLIAFSANTTYERLIAHKKICSTLSLGLNYLYINFFSEDHLFIPSLRYGIMTGIHSKHHFEVNAGPILPAVISDGLDFVALDFVSEGILLGFNLGYRYQYQDSKIFRTGFGFPELFYVGFGFSF